MKNEVTVKLTKNPENFIYVRSMFNYIMMLEDTGRLNELPKNLFVYYVISLFADEVNNGGIEQYLGNSSKKTYGNLRTCAEYLAHDVITPFLWEVCDYIDSFPPDTESDAFSSGLEVFDNRFYQIEKKYEFCKVALKYYKDNFEIDKLTIPVVKERESDTCRYFTVAKEEKCKDVAVALKAFLDILASFPDHRWSIEIWNFLDTYRVEAYNFDQTLNLKEILANWNNEDALRIARFQVCDFFKEVRWYTYAQEGEDIYKSSVWIEPSGYDKNEYWLKYRHESVTYATNIEVGKNEFVLWNRSRPKAPALYDTIKDYLENNYINYPNIEKVFETIAWKK